jgi:hypothetical protein
VVTFWFDFALMAKGFDIARAFNGGDHSTLEKVDGG